jgi:hypothetical protein
MHNTDQGYARDVRLALALLLNDETTTEQLPEIVSHFGTGVLDEAIRVTKANLGHCQALLPILEAERRRRAPPAEDRP